MSSIVRNKLIDSCKFNMNPLLMILSTALILAAGAAKAEDFSSTDIQLLYTTKSKADAANGTGTSNGNLTTLRAEHFGTWAYGDNYLDLDLYQGKDVGGDGAGSFGADVNRQYFFIYVPRFSISKLAGLNLTNGFVKNIYAAYRMERSSYADFRADNYGVSVDLAVPGTVFFEQDLYARKTNFDKGTKFLSRTVWLAPFNVGSVGFHFDGLILVKSTDANKTDIFAQPDFLVDLLPKGAVQVGMRLEYHSHQHYERTSPNAMLKVNF